ncbi:MAG: fibrobacter succinogenes major paralogous domain-containing protein, partial [Sediminibacterium sp.]
APGTTGNILTSNGTTWTSAAPSGGGGSGAAVFLPTIVIGTQQWMEKNLDVMTYRNGEVIPQETDNTKWAGLTTGAWCWYSNSADNGAIYGKLYNWYAVNDPRGLAPQGWHIPTDAEWTTLGTLLGGDAAAGGKMKTTGTTIWNTPNTSATNQSGYAGLPGGFRGYGGAFSYVGFNGYWWSATVNNLTTAWYRGLYFNNGSLFRDNDYKAYGFSVRCLRD